MTYHPRRTTFLKQLTIMARRAHRWAMVQRLTALEQHSGITKHVGRAY